MAKTVEQMQHEAAELKEKRTLMGYTQSYIADLCGIEQGNYSRMERGMLNCDKPLSKVKELYGDWVKQQEKKIKANLAYIKSIA